MFDKLILKVESLVYKLTVSKKQRLALIASNTILNVAGE